MVHHLAPNGVAGFVLANGSMSSNQSSEGQIRESLIEKDLVDRTHRELTDEDIARIAATYHAWRGGEGTGEYADVARFLQERGAGGSAQARSCPHPRSLCRGRSARGRR